ncbi:hypothetical protein [Coxiella burnetii]|nr:hypothetical protein [Coxiella burnetii]
MNVSSAPNLGSQYKKRFSIRKLQDMVKGI